MGGFHMFHPIVSPWGPISAQFMLSPGFYYVVSDLMDGYMLTCDFAIAEGVGDGVLSGRLFDESYFAFPASSDAMMLVLCSRNLAWHTFRNFCDRSNIRLTFHEFFSYANETVRNMFPLVMDSLSVSSRYVEDWIKDIHPYIKYLWKEPLHPFSSEGIPLYIPKGWSDGTMQGDLKPSIVSDDGFFRIYFDRPGVAYYLTHSRGTMNMTISDFDIFTLIEKAKEQKMVIEREGLKLLKNPMRASAY